MGTMKPTDELSPDLRESVERVTDSIATLLAQGADADAFRDGVAHGVAAIAIMREVGSLARDLQAARAECERSDDFGTRAELGRLRAESRLAAQARVVEAAKAWDATYTPEGDPVQASIARANLHAVVDALKEVR